MDAKTVMMNVQNNGLASTILTDILDMVMSPVKSTSGIRYYAATKFVSCQLCQEPRCPPREAPYDTALLNKYYQ